MSSVPSSSSNPQESSSEATPHTTSALLTYRSRLFQKHTSSLRRSRPVTVSTSAPSTDSLYSTVTTPDPVLREETEDEALRILQPPKQSSSSIHSEKKTAEMGDNNNNNDDDDDEFQDLIRTATSQGDDKDIDNDDNEDEDVAGDDEVCKACGFESSYVPEGMVKCQRCKLVSYCSVDCLTWDWEHGGHSQQCHGAQQQQHQQRGPEHSGDQGAAQPVLATANNNRAPSPVRRSSLQQQEIRVQLPHQFDVSHSSAIDDSISSSLVDDDDENDNDDENMTQGVKSMDVQQLFQNNNNNMMQNSSTSISSKDFFFSSSCASNSLSETNNNNNMPMTMTSVQLFADSTHSIELLPRKEKTEVVAPTAIVAKKPTEDEISPLQAQTPHQSTLNTTRASPYVHHHHIANTTTNDDDDNDNDGDGDDTIDDDDNNEIDEEEDYEDDDERIYTIPGEEYISSNSNHSSSNNKQKADNNGSKLERAPFAASTPSLAQHVGQGNLNNTTTPSVEEESLDIMNDKGEDDADSVLHSIIEEESSVSDEPEREGSWRSRDVDIYTDSSRSRHESLLDKTTPNSSDHRRPPGTGPVVPMPTSTTAPMDESESETMYDVVDVQVQLHTAQQPPAEAAETSDEPVLAPTTASDESMALRPNSLRLARRRIPSSHSTTPSPANLVFHQSNIIDPSGHSSSHGSIDPSSDTDMHSFAQDSSHHNNATVATRTSDATDAQETTTTSTTAGRGNLQSSQSYHRSYHSGHQSITTNHSSGAGHRRDDSESDHVDSFALDDDGRDLAILPITVAPGATAAATPSQTPPQPHPSSANTTASTAASSTSSDPPLSPVRSTTISLKEHLSKRSSSSRSLPNSPSRQQSPRSLKEHLENSGGNLLGTESPNSIQRFFSPQQASPQSQNKNATTTNGNKKNNIRRNEPSLSPLKDRKRLNLDEDSDQQQKLHSSSTLASLSVSNLQPTAAALAEERASTDDSQSVRSNSLTNAVSFKEFRHAYMTSDSSFCSSRDLKNFHQIYHSDTGDNASTIGSRSLSGTSSCGNSSLAQTLEQMEYGKEQNEEQEETGGDEVSHDATSTRTPMSRRDSNETRSSQLSRSEALKMSINKALRDYEKLYGAEAARGAFQSLAQAVSNDDDKDEGRKLPATAPTSPVKGLLPNANTPPSARSDPIVQQHPLHLSPRRSSNVSVSSWALPTDFSVFSSHLPSDPDDAQRNSPPGSGGPVSPRQALGGKKKATNISARLSQLHERASQLKERNNANNVQASKDLSHPGAHQELDQRLSQLQQEAAKQQLHTGDDYRDALTLPKLYEKQLRVEEEKSEHMAPGAVPVVMPVFDHTDRAAAVSPFVVSSGKSDVVAAPSNGGLLNVPSWGSSASVSRTSISLAASSGEAGEDGPRYLRYRSTLARGTAALASNAARLLNFTSSTDEFNPPPLVESGSNSETKEEDEEDKFEDEPDTAQPMVLTPERRNDQALRISLSTAAASNRSDPDGGYQRYRSMLAEKVVTPDRPFSTDDDSDDDDSEDDEINSTHDPWAPVETPERYKLNLSDGTSLESPRYHVYRSSLAARISVMQNEETIDEGGEDLALAEEGAQDTMYAHYARAEEEAALLEDRLTNYLNQNETPKTPTHKRSSWVGLGADLSSNNSMPDSPESVRLSSSESRRVACTMPEESRVAGSSSSAPLLPKPKQTNNETEVFHDDIDPDLEAGTMDHKPLIQSHAAAESGSEKNSTGREERRNRCCWWVVLAICLLAIAAGGVVAGLFFLVLDDDDGGGRTAPLIAEPTDAPARLPTKAPSQQPSKAPVTTLPPTTRMPTFRPSVSPSSHPSLRPSLEPSFEPSAEPTSSPTSSYAPTLVPTDALVLLASVSADGGEALQQSGSPQNRAYLWLVGTNITSFSNETIIQRYALATMYYSLEGVQWTEQNGWLTEADECSWYFDTDACENGTIVTLDLGFNGLGGSIPNEIALFQSVTTINLSGGMGNKIGGKLPWTLSLLTKLERFTLTNNEIIGGIPSSLNWPQLTLFDASRNKLTGSVPEDIGLLVSLTSLDLASNELSGNLPSSIGNLTNIKIIDISDNQLKGALPDSMGNLVKLHTLKIGDNQFTWLPGSLRHLVNLLTFVASNNNLTGPLLDDWGTLDAMENLDLSHNAITGPIPPSMGSLASIHILNLSFNKFSGSIPDELGNLTSVFHLFLNANHLSGSIPSALSGLDVVSILRVDNNDLNGTVPDLLCDTLGENNLPKFYLDCNATNVLDGEIACPLRACCTHCCTDGGQCACIFQNDLPFLC